MPESGGVHNNMMNLDMDASSVEIKYPVPEDMHGVMDGSNSHHGSR